MKRPAVIGVTLTLGVLAAVALFVAQYGSPIRTTVAVLSISQLDATTIEVVLECGGRPEVRIVSEDDDAVVIRARLQQRPGDCASVVPVDLSQPLLGRSVIDDSTGREVEVWNRLQGV